MKIYCATTNAGKFREFREIIDYFGQSRVVLGTVEGLESLPPCEESGLTFEENAARKAAYYSHHGPGLLFADDSGLVVDALHGAPGVFSARFAGNGAGDAANNSLLLERLRGVEDRGARFVCAIAVAERGHALATFRGEVEGRIIDQPRGENGFGYDPLFFYEPYGCTFGEATPEQKTMVSHRSRAVEQMVRWLLR